MIKLGCHVSNKGAEMLLGSLAEAVSYGANCFMVYLGPPQNTRRKALAEFHPEQFRAELTKAGFRPEDVIVHAPYIINLAQPDPVKRQFAVDFLTKEVELMTALGLKYLVLHPGAFVGAPAAEGLARIAEGLRQVIAATPESSVVIALETMAGKGTEAASNFAEVAYLLANSDRERVAVCLDTCHTWDAGYDWVGDYEGVMAKLAAEIGLERIKVIHLNDSKNPLAAHKDRHENIGMGAIGFAALHKILTDPRFAGVPQILETPYIPATSAEDDTKKVYAPYKEEIAMLRSGKFDPALYAKIRQNKSDV